MSVHTVSVIVFAMLCSVLATACVGPMVSADQSQFRQQILPIDCNYTTIETGSGVINDVDCPNFPPVVSVVNVNGGRPIIVGVYDAIHTARLRVWLNNRWYVYGVDSELSANGNSWTLNLSGLIRPFNAGAYVLLVSTEGFDGMVQQASISVTIDQVKPNDSGTDSDGAATDQNWLANTGRNALVSVIIAITLILVGILLLRKIKKDKRQL